MLRQARERHAAKRRLLSAFLSGLRKPAGPPKVLRLRKSLLGRLGGRQQPFSIQCAIASLATAGRQSRSPSRAPIAAVKVAWSSGPPAARRRQRSEPTSSAIATASG